MYPSVPDGFGLRVIKYFPRKCFSTTLGINLDNTKDQTIRFFIVWLVKEKISSISKPSRAAWSPWTFVFGNLLSKLPCKLVHRDDQILHYHQSTVYEVTWNYQDEWQDIGFVSHVHAWLTLPSFKSLLTIQHCVKLTLTTQFLIASSCPYSRTPSSELFHFLFL